jgi:hypothetical protein
MSDVFREVSEDLRRDQLKQLWQRYGKFVIGGAVLIVVIVAGYQIVLGIQQSRSAESGDRYQAAADLYIDGELEAAEAAFLALAEDGYGGYPTLALMSAANIRAERGDLAGAAEALDAVVADADTEPRLRDIARVRAAYYLVDTSPLAEIRQRLEPFTEAGHPYRVVALEIMVVSAITAEEYDLALEWVIGMAQDPFAGQASTARANSLFSYILENRPEAAPPPAADLPPGLAPALQPGAAGFAIDDLPAPAFNPAAPAAAPEAAPAPAIPFGNEPVVPLAPGFNPAAN